MSYQPLPHHELEKIAVRLRKQHGVFDGKRLLIEDMVQRMGYALFPVDGLRDEMGVEAYIPKRPKTIIVDRAEMDGGNPRYFFTLAEELAHIEIHLSRPPVGVQTPQQFHDWVMSLSSNSYQNFECDAKYLAGALLMPPDEFKEKFNSLLQAQLKALGKAGVRNTVIYYVLRQMFMTYVVSFDAATIRARKLNLISQAELDNLQKHRAKRILERNTLLGA